MKDVQTSLVIRESKTTRTYHFTFSRLNKLKGQTIISIGEEVEKWNPHPSLVQNGIATLKSSLEIPQNVKHRVTIWPRNSTLAIPPKIIENLCPPKKVYINVHGCIIPNSPIVQYKCPLTDDYMSISIQSNIKKSHKKRMKYWYML